MSRHFCRLVLRTTDPDAARTFYARVLDDEGATIVPLHDEVIARGARPHWLGMIGVDDVSGMADAFVLHGATRLGPTQRDADGDFALLRDPGGAVVALATPSEVRRPIVEWYVLDSTSVAACASAYASLFGWHVAGHVRLGDDVFYQFAWSSDREPVGALTDIAGRPDRHPHWLYFFRVASLARALEAVTAGGGKALRPPGKPTVAVCEDAQGAAFGLAEGAV